MIRTLPRIYVLVLCVFPNALSGADLRPSFEVASVHPAPPLAGPLPFFVSSGPGSNSPRRISWVQVDLLSPLLRAFQLSMTKSRDPAGWSEQFTIIANIPPNTDENRFDLMLQRLLEERFHLKFHRETKKFPAYELVIAKGGPKIKPATPETRFPLAPISDPLGPGWFPSVAPGCISYKRSAITLASLRIEALSPTLRTHLGR